MGTEGPIDGGEMFYDEYLERSDALHIYLLFVTYLKIDELTRVKVY